MTLVFLNATHRPCLSRENHKRMRAHITKSNFAQRRLRLSQQMNSDNDTKTSSPQSTTSSEIDTATSLIKVERLHDSFEESSALIEERRSLVIALLFPHAPDFPSSAEESNWLNLIAVGGVLFQATMAVAVRFRSPRETWQLKALQHLSKAQVGLVHQMQTRDLLSEGMLGCIVTLALGERLGGNESAWRVHMNGLVDVVRERHLQGIDMPLWMWNLMIVDTANDLLGYSRTYHSSLQPVLSKYHHRVFTEAARLCGTASSWRASVRQTLSLSSSTNITTSVPQLDAMAEILVTEARRLQAYPDPCVQVSAISSEILVLLTRQIVNRRQHNMSNHQRHHHENNLEDLAACAHKLKLAFSSMPIRECPYMHLTSVPLMLGAIASAHDNGDCDDNNTHQWYLDQFTNASRLMQSRGWLNPLAWLQQALSIDSDLEARFNTIWPAKVIVIVFGAPN